MILDSMQVQSYGPMVTWVKTLLFLVLIKVYQFKVKDSEIKQYSLCVGNISKDFTINNMNKTGLKVKKKFLLIITLKILTIF